MERCTFLRCEKISDAAVCTKTYLLSSPESSVLGELKPGRYIVINHPDQSGSPRMRNYTVTDITDDGKIEITVKGTGAGGVSDNLADTTTRGSLICMNDVGGSVTADSILGFSHVLMLAGGIGITLPIALIRSLAQRYERGESIPKVTLFVSAQTVANIPFLAELLALDFKCTWFKVCFFISREKVSVNSSHFISGRVDKASIGSVVANAAVICGSYEFSIAQLDVVKRHNGQIPCFIEAFSHAVSLPQTKISSSNTFVNVQVAGNRHRFEVDADTTLLEALQDNRVAIRSQCRSGICGSCRIKIIKGCCRKIPDFSLSLKEQKSGYALACCTYGEGGELFIEI